MRRTHFSLAAGITYFVLGGLFLGDRAGYLVMKPSYVLPLALIAIGITIVVGRVDLKISLGARDRGTQDEDSAQT